MVDSWNAAVLNERIKKQNVPSLLDQVETGTWNLVRTPYYHGSGATAQGLKYVVNDDATITFTGSTTANFNYNIKRYTQEMILPAGNYHLKGCPADGSLSTYVMRIGYVVPPSTTVTWIGYDMGGGLDFTLSGDTVIQLNIVIYANYSCPEGGLTFKPEIDVIEIPLCTETTAGNYSLKATVDSDGVVTYSWEAIT